MKRMGMACLWLWCLGAVAQEVAAPPLADKLEVTTGVSRTSQSLLHGVLVTYTNDPTLNVNYETSAGFASMQNGVGLWLVRQPQFKAGVSVNYMMGRQEKSDPRYTGMGSVAGSAMSYAWAEWQPIPEAVTLYGNAGHSWRSASGTLAQWGGTLGVPLIGAVNGFVDVSRSWGNQTYVQQYYGVSPSQSQHSGYSVFTPDRAGVLYANAQMGVDWEVDRDTDVIVAYGKSTASGLLMQSPLLQTRSQTLSAVVLSKRFR